MQRFIARENIRRFTEQLAASQDEQERVVLRKLIAEEHERLAQPEQQERSSDGGSVGEGDAGNG
jgi:hypothetical protein